MKRTLTPLGLVLAAVLATAVGAPVVMAHSPAPLPQSQAALPSPQPADRVLTLPKSPASPVIDGDLSDPAWRAAARADGFWISEQQHRPTEPTVVLVTADSRHLYIAFECIDSNPSTIEALQTRRDGDLGYPREH